MKINPLGVQSYQQLARREQTETVPKDNKAAEPGNQTMAIRPQSESAGSRISVSATRGSFAEHLSPEEKQALEILFTRFKQTERFGPSYRKESAPANENSTLGGMLDVKV